MSITLNTISELFKKSFSFKDQMREKSSIRDIWVKRVEQPLHPSNLPPQIYQKI